MSEIWVPVTLCWSNQWWWSRNAAFAGKEPIDPKKLAFLKEFYGFRGNLVKEEIYLKAVAKTIFAPILLNRNLILDY